VGGVTPARAHTSRIESPASPPLARSAPAASRIARRVASEETSRARSAVTRAGTGPVLYRRYIFTSTGSGIPNDMATLSISALNYGYRQAADRSASDLGEAAREIADGARVLDAAVSTREPQGATGAAVRSPE